MIRILLLFLLLNIRIFYTVIESKKKKCSFSICISALQSICYRVVYLPSTYITYILVAAAAEHCISQFLNRMCMQIRCHMRCDNFRICCSLNFVEHISLSTILIVIMAVNLKLELYYVVEIPTLSTYLLQNLSHSGS